MEPIIISENLDQQEKAIQDINSFCAKINSVLPEFEKETGYSLSVNEVQNLLNVSDHTSLIANVKKSMEKSLSTFNQLTQRTLKAGIDEYVYSFASKIKRFNSMPGYTHLQSLSLKNDELNLSKENEQVLRQSFRYCIETEKAKGFYEKHKAACESLNEFSKYVSENSRIQPFNVANLAHTFFYLERETGTVKTQSIAYERALK